MRLRTRIITAALALTPFLAATPFLTATPASASCLPPKVVVTHGTTWAEAHVEAGCNIRVWVQTRFGPYFGPYKSGNSYSDVINLPAPPTQGGWQQSGGPEHRTF